MISICATHARRMGSFFITIPQQHDVSFASIRQIDEDTPLRSGQFQYRHHQPNWSAKTDWNSNISVCWSVARSPIHQSMRGAYRRSLITVPSKKSFRLKPKNGIGKSKPLRYVQVSKSAPAIIARSVFSSVMPPALGTILNRRWFSPLSQLSENWVIIQINKWNKTRVLEYALTKATMLKPSPPPCHWLYSNSTYRCSAQRCMPPSDWPYNTDSP